MHRSLLALALAAGAVLAVPATAERVDLPLRVGESATGDVASPGTVSTCAFLVTAGDKRKLSVTVKRAKGSRLEPLVTLVAPDGEPVDVVAAGGKLKEKSSGTKIKLNDVAQSGLWRVEVRGSGDTTGAYAIATKAKEGLSLKADFIVTLGGEHTVPIAVGDAQALTITAKRARKSSLTPGIEILDPSGALLQSATGAARLDEKKGSSKLQKHELPSFGTYTIRFSGVLGTGGAGVYSIKAAPTKLKGKRPTADAGPAFEAEPSLQATLDGSASSTAGKGSLDFVWTQVSGTPVTLSDRNAARPTFTAPAADESLAFQLAVSENALQSAPRLVVVEVAQRPIADPGRARVVAPGATLTLDGGASVDRSGRGLRGTWRIVDGPGTLSDADTLTPRFDAPNAGGVTRLGLLVDDGRARSFESETLVVTSGAPTIVADAGREQYVGRMATVWLSGLASQRAGATLSAGAAWEQLSGPPVTLAGGDTFFPSFQAPREPADLLFELTVDGDDTTPHRTWVRVRPGNRNRAPVSDAGSHGVASGGSVVLNASASSDVDGGDPADRWAAILGDGATVTDPAAESTTATGLDDTQGIWVFPTQALDDHQQGPPDLKRVTGAQYAGAPLVDAGANQTVTATTAVTLQGAATQSPGGGGITYAWRQLSGREWFEVAAESATFLPTAPRPTFRLRNGISSLTTTRSITLELVATDSLGTSVPDYVTITFTGLPGNGIPIAQAAASSTNPLPGSTVTLTATGNDPDGDPITFRWTQVSGPTVTLQGGPTSLSPTFQAPDAGTLVFDLVANDGIDDGPPSRVTVTVDRRPVAVASVTPPGGGAGVSVTFDGSGSSDPEGETLSYTWSQVAGTSVSFPANDASFTVTAPDGGMTLRLVVNDGRQDSLPVMATYSDNAPPTVAPTATVGGSTIVQAAYGALVTLLANPSDSDPATFTWRQIGVSSTSPAVTLSSTSTQNTSFAVPSPVVGARYGSVPQLSFGVRATRDGVPSTEQVVTISIYASFNDTTLPAGAKTVWGIIGASSCASCHSGTSSFCPVGSGSNATGFGMGTPTAFINNAVNVASCSSVKPRIATGSATASASSFLVDRLLGQGGGFMPPGSGGIALQDIFLIMDWIDQGAVSNR